MFVDYPIFRLKYIILISVTAIFVPNTYYLHSVWVLSPASAGEVALVILSTCVFVCLPVSNIPHELRDESVVDLFFGPKLI